MKRILFAIVCLAILAAGALSEKLIPITQTAPSADSSTGVVINEIMPTGTSAIQNEYGEKTDWFEVFNGGGETVDLEGWTVCQNELGYNAFTFGDVTLAPGACALVFADKLSAQSASIYHAPFKLSASGGRLILKNADGVVADDVTYPAVSKNDVYMRGETGAWEMCAQYTPGLANTLENYQFIIDQVVDDPVVISEIVADNASYALGSAGEYYDYIELYNTSDKAVSLDGYYLSDERNDLKKWKIPAAEIPANGYLVIYASGLDQAVNGELHANFKLSKDGEDAVFTNPDGLPVSSVQFPALLADQAYSLFDGEYTTQNPPTPGAPNTLSAAQAFADDLSLANAAGVTINEIAASPSTLEYDWVELYNSSSQAVDLSGYGLSDDVEKPRKWQFPDGTVLQPGQYLGVFMSGKDTLDNSGYFHTSFALSIDGGYSLTLSDASGTLLERVYVPEQYYGVTYGRLDGEEGFVYMSGGSPLSQNVGPAYAGKTDLPVFSTAGGLYDEGEVLTVEITAGDGAKIYYTTDCTEPSQSSTLYTGPITLSENTIIRARAFADGEIESYITSQSYFFGLSHTMRVVSMVVNPADMFDETVGMYAYGPNASSKYPYTGANFWEETEIPAGIEMFDTDGSTLISQSCGIRLHGQYSRAENQKGFKVIARNRYGSDRFYANIFSNRDYTEYQSFLLRSSGQDGMMTRMRDSVLQTLAETTSVMYQETELCVVYINGQYWGQYNIRERINEYSICQFEGWEGQEDDINIVKANRNVLQGSDDTYQTMLAWVKENGVPDDAALAKVGEVIDLENYIDYHALEIFVGNGDTANVKRYMNPNGDGKWRYVFFDLDWAFYTDTNSIRRWLTSGGMGVNKGTDNALFIALMKNAAFREQFLTRMGEMMATEWTTEKLIAKIQERYYELLPELPAQLARWGMPESDYNNHLKRLVTYAQTRPAKLIGYFQETFSLNDEQLQKYFGAALKVIEEAS